MCHGLALFLFTSFVFTDYRRFLYTFLEVKMVSKYQLQVSEQYWFSIAASQMAQQMNQMGAQPGPGMMGPGVDPHKQFLQEAENIEVTEHKYILAGVENRLLQSTRVS